MNWVKVEDELPEVGTAVLLFNKLGENWEQQYETAVIFNAENPMWFATGRDYYIERFDYWCYLEEPNE